MFDELETSNETDGEYPLASFLDNFGDSLLEAVSDQHPPVYERPCQKRAELMNSLARPPYPEQAECVQAVLALFTGSRREISNPER